MGYGLYTCNPSLKAQHSGVEAGRPENQGLKVILS